MILGKTAEQVTIKRVNDSEPIESFTLFVYFPEIAFSACAFGLMLIAIRQSAVAS